MNAIHDYGTRVAGSNLAPLTITIKDARRGGIAADLTGATVTITIVDETTKEVIVQDAAAEPNETNPYWIEYFLSEQVAAKITRPSTWLAQWKLTAGDGRVEIFPVLCRVSVRPRVL